MKITKLVHACLLVETEDSVAIFDPGAMSFQSKLLDIASLQRLDEIIITHEHFDHYSEDFLKALVAKFPKATVITTPSLVKQLSDKGIVAQSERTSAAELFTAPHESMEPLAPGPTIENVGVHYKNLLTHPGDCYHINQSKDIFALPLAGPWGAAIEGVRLASSLKPKYVVPIHDWMWNETWKSDMYERLEKYFLSVGIKFIKAVDGQAVEL